MVSEITTLRKDQHSRIGRLLGELGSATPENLEAAEKLAAMAPAETGQKMQSLLKSLGVEQRDEYRLEYPKEGGFKRILVSSQVVGSPLGDADMQRLTRFMTPPTVEQCEGWLAELSVISAHRQEGEFTGALKLQAYIKRLLNYPADIVHDVLMERTWKFFPTWAEVESALETLEQPRRELLALANACEPAKPKNVVELPTYREPPTADERGPLPYKPEPSPPVSNVEHLKEELRILEADKELAASEHGQAYAQSLIQRIAALEGPKPVNTNTTREAG